MKYAWIACQREAYPLPAMCTTLGVSSCGYRAWPRGGRTNGKRLSNAQLLYALTMARFRRKPAPGLIHHSDRESQYASGVFQDKLIEYGMTCSMSRKGNCWDNAPTESIFNSLQNGWVHGTRYDAHDAARADLFDYIEGFYNRSRRHSTLGYQSPTQFLQHWIAAQAVQKLPA